MCIYIYIYECTNKCIYYVPERTAPFRTVLAAAPMIGPRYEYRYMYVYTYRH